jgi:hypothetical protein
VAPRSVRPASAAHGLRPLRYRGVSHRIRPGRLRPLRRRSNTRHRRSEKAQPRSTERSDPGRTANAFIPAEKLVGYCLNPDHPRGKDKARVFASVLGFTQRDASQLAVLVRQAAVDGEVTKETTTAFGRFYRVDWTIPSRSEVVLRTIWEIAVDEEIPRLVSAFIA